MVGRMGLDPLYAGSARSGATFNLDRCAPYPQDGAGALAMRKRHSRAITRLVFVALQSIGFPTFEGAPLAGYPLASFDTLH